MLLHGFPTSSFIFRNLIPELADRYRVIAPDYVNSVLEYAPSVNKFDYTFDALADMTTAAARPTRASRSTRSTSRITAAPSGGSRHCEIRRRSPRSSPRTETAQTPVSSPTVGRTASNSAARTDARDRGSSAEQKYHVRHDQVPVPGGRARRGPGQPDPGITTTRCSRAPGTTRSSSSSSSTTPPNPKLYPALHDYLRAG